MKITLSPRLQSQLNSIVMVFLILGMAVLLAWLSVRFQTQIDWTQSGRHTLSHASQEVLSRMIGPVEITAYAREDGSLRQAVEKIFDVRVDIGKTLPRLKFFATCALH